MTGEIGFCGYFKEYDHELGEDERVVFAKDEIPPPYKEEEQPEPPTDQWNQERLEKANRNYGVERSEERRVGKECRSRWSPYP
mgnify:CR=1 FL=1